jgi:hypothetical protein
VAVRVDPAEHVDPAERPESTTPTARGGADEQFEMPDMSMPSIHARAIQGGAWQVLVSWARAS